MVLVDLMAIFICNLKKDEEKKDFFKRQIKSSVRIDITVLIYVVVIVIALLCTDL